MDLAFRLDSETLEHSQVLEDLKTDFSHLIVSVETSAIVGKRHIHGCGKYVGKVAVGKNWSRPIRQKLQNLYAVSGPQLYIAKKKGNMESYTLKDGEYVYYGYTEEEIQQFVDNSYEKTLSYKQRKQQINQQFLDKPDLKAWTLNRMKLMTEFEIPYYRHKLKAELHTLLFTKFESAMHAETSEILGEIYKNYNKHIQ